MSGLDSLWPGPLCRRLRGLPPAALSLSVCPIPAGPGCHSGTERLWTTDKATASQHPEQIPQTGGLWTLLLVQCLKSLS